MLPENETYFSIFSIVHYTVAADSLYTFNKKLTAYDLCFKNDCALNFLWQKPTKPKAGSFMS